MLTKEQGSRGKAQGQRTKGQGSTAKARNPKDPNPNYEQPTPNRQLLATSNQTHTNHALRITCSPTSHSESPPHCSGYRGGRFRGPRDEPAQVHPTIHRPAAHA